MKNLKERLETVETYHEDFNNIFPKTEQRKLRDYKHIIEDFRKSNPLLDDICEGKTTLIEEVDKLEELTNEKYGGFKNFWKPYRDLDAEYNKKIEDLESILGYETQKLKTGGDKTIEIAKYVGHELITYPLGAIGSIVTLVVSCMPFVVLDQHTSYTTPDSVVYGVMAFSLAVGCAVKWYNTPQVANRRARKQDIKELRKRAKPIQAIIDEVYPKTEGGQE